MKRGTIIPIVIALFVLALFMSGKNTYNNLVVMDEQVTSAWAQVEKETLTSVIEARAKATSVTVDPTNLSPQAIQQFQEAQEGLSGALSRLLVSVERYPDLKANQQFQQLQVQLEGTENRIAVERRNFNNEVQAYNTSIRRFPQNVYAGILGFDKKGYFEATAGAENVPQVNFD